MPAPSITRLLDRLRGEGVGAVLARGASLFLLIQVAGVGLSFGVHVALARALGTADYGTYVYVYSWALVLLLVCRAGLGTASLRFVASFAAVGDWGRLRGFLRTTHATVALASAAVSLTTATVMLLLGDRLAPALRATFLVACLAIPLHAFLQVHGFVLRGFKRVLLSQLPPSVMQPALLGSGVLLFPLLAPGRLDAPGAMALNAGAALCGVAFTTVAIRAVRPAPLRDAEPVVELRPWLRVAAPLMLVNAMNMVLQRTDILLVGSLLGPEDAGVYAAAARIATVLVFGLTAVNAWAAPLIADLHARGDQEGLQRLVRLAARGIFGFTLPAAVGVVVFGRQLLGLFGPEFAAAYVPLVILAAGQMVNALAGPVGFLMTMTGRQDTAARILGVHAVLNVGLLALLVPPYGIVGAAAATGLTRASWNLVMALAVWRSMRLRATIV